MGQHEKVSRDFYIAPAGPKRCVYLMPDDITFSHNGKPLFQAEEINRLVFNNAARYCVSYDAAFICLREAFGGDSGVMGLRPPLGFAVEAAKNPKLSASLTTQKMGQNVTVLKSPYGSLGL